MHMFLKTYLQCYIYIVWRTSSSCEHIMYNKNIPFQDSKAVLSYVQYSVVMAMNTLSLRILQQYYINIYKK